MWRSCIFEKKICCYHMPLPPPPPWSECQLLLHNLPEIRKKKDAFRLHQKKKMHCCILLAWQMERWGSGSLEKSPKKSFKQCLKKSFKKCPEKCPKKCLKNAEKIELVSTTVELQYVEKKTNLIVMWLSVLQKFFLLPWSFLQSRRDTQL